METVQQLGFEIWLDWKTNVESAKKLNEAIFNDLHHLEKFVLCERIIEFSKNQYGKKGIAYSCYQTTLDDIKIKQPNKQLQEKQLQEKILDILQFSKQVYLNSISLDCYPMDILYKLMMVYIDTSLYITSIEYASL
jgi:hypothetical protein